MECENYEVFLNFRGDDTGNNFTSHLFYALRRRGISTFFANNTDALSPLIPKAIEESQIFFVVFSKNYAASTWCFDQLVRIAESYVDSNEFGGKFVFPIFYKVDPSYIIQYTGAFAGYEERFVDDLEKLGRRRKWMSIVANRSGWHVNNHRPEAKVIDDIVERALGILSRKFQSVDLVGMQSRVEAFEKILDIGSNGGVRVVGVCGMGGLGKTALASLVYHKISDQFDRSCFLSNVNELSQLDRLHAVLQQLLNALMNKNHAVVDVLTPFFRHRLSWLKILLVIDSVNDLELLEHLNIRHFGEGSRVIITTRDEHVLKSFGVDGIYRVELLNKDEEFQLFCTSAFNCDHPLTGYEEISQSVLEYCQGLPLAIKSWGSFLLHRNILEWRSALAKPLKFPDDSIVKVLKQSYYELEENERFIFLDIACFFVGEKINDVQKIFSDTDICFEMGIEILIEKSLMTISNQRIHMHYMLQEMGREIVGQESIKNPGRRSRMWSYDDFRHVMETNTATDCIEAIVLNQDDDQGSPLSANAFRKMTRLRLLKIRNVTFSGSLEYLSNHLRYLSWHGYPFTCLPSHFKPKNLVELIMPESSITQLWEGLKILPKLRNINLRGSKNLIKTPDFSGFPNLETLDLEGCTGLLQLHPTILSLQKLTFLNLKDCSRLISIPNNLSGMSSLETLNLDGCSILVKLLANPSCPSFVKTLCYIFLCFLKGIKNYKSVICRLVHLIYSILWV